MAKECNRRGISDRGAASIASAVLQDVGLIASTERSSVIRKICRERSKYRNKVQEQFDASRKDLTALYFDGRKDSTLVQVQRGGKTYLSTVSVEHYTLVQEPQSKYIDRVSVLNGESTYKTIKLATVDYFARNTTTLQHLIADGCDSTNANTGVSVGMIRLLELELGRPLQWFICLLHANELLHH